MRLFSHSHFGWKKSHWMLVQVSFCGFWIVKCSESRTNDTKSSVNKISSELLVGRAWKCDFVLFSVLSLQRWLTTVTQPYNVNNNLKIRCDILCERFFSLHPFVKQNPLSFGCTEREESETRSKASASKSQKKSIEPKCRTQLIAKFHLMIIQIGCIMADKRYVDAFIWPWRRKKPFEVRDFWVSSIIIIIIIIMYNSNFAWNLSFYHHLVNFQLSQCLFAHPSQDLLHPFLHWIEKKNEICHVIYSAYSESCNAFRSEWHDNHVEK